MKYVDNNTIPFHVPGHKKGIGAPDEFKNFIGENPFKIDVTIFKSVDSLHNPTSSIREAENLQLMLTNLKILFSVLMEQLSQYKR